MQEVVIYFILELAETTQQALGEAFSGLVIGGK
jgi:hypothetical protein